MAIFNLKNSTAGLHSRKRNRLPYHSRRLLARYVYARDDVEIKLRLPQRVPSNVVQFHREEKISHERTWAFPTFDPKSMNSAVMPCLKARQIGA